MDLVRPGQELAHYGCVKGSSPESAPTGCRPGIDHRCRARPRWGMTDSAATGADYFDDEPEPGTDAGSGGTPGSGTDAQVPEGQQTVEHIADEIRDDIRLGHVVDDDVNHVLQERLDGAGIAMRPEDVDTLAEEIERDAST